MNLWFRLLLMLFRRPWRKPVDALGTTVVRMRVWPLDLDFNRHVTNGRYLTLADVGRMDFVLRSGAFRVAFRQKALPIVGDTWEKFRRELKIFQTFEIHTRMLGWDEKNVRCQDIFLLVWRTNSSYKTIGSVTLRPFPVFCLQCAGCHIGALQQRP